MTGPDLKIGDVVILVSGGPKMTVDRRISGAIGHEPSTCLRCVWFDGNNRMSGDFAQASLRSAENW